MTRRRYPGDGLGPTSATVPRNRYIVCWKDPVQPEKGTVWFWCSPELVSHAQLSSDDGIPFRCLSYRPAFSRPVASTGLPLGMTAPPSPSRPARRSPSR